MLCISKPFPLLLCILLACVSSGSHPVGTNKALDSAHFRDTILAKQARLRFAKGRAIKGSRWWLAIALILVLAVSLSADGLRYWQGELYDLGQVVPRVGEQRLEAAESLPEGTTLPSLRSSRPASFLIQLGEKDDETGRTNAPARLFPVSGGPLPPAGPQLDDHQACHIISTEQIDPLFVE